MNKKWLTLLIKIILSSLILTFLFYKTDINKFYNLIKGTDMLILTLTFVLYLIAQWVSAYRWKMLLHTERMDVSFYNLIAYYYIGMFFNLFMPTLVGGDVVRGYYLYKKSNKGGESVASIFVERLSGFFALITIALLSLIIGYSYIKNEPTVTTLLLLITVGFFTSVIIIINKRIREMVNNLMKGGRFEGLRKKLKNVSEAAKKYKNHKEVLFNVVLLSFLVQIIGIFIFYLLSKALNLNVSLAYFFLFIPIIIVISMAPITLGGLGVREFVFIFLFHKVGLETAEALSLSLLWFILVTISSLAGGVIFLLTENPSSFHPEARG
ncbi:MAG: flippase-like domain-containing protein [Nitrospirae bacterium]|nr:flippase-like domain-containing protein [Nitrospirota bacterium]